jgi:hypothetical protein
MHVSQWLGHSEDPWLPSDYPNTWGSSDGTVVTASPTFSYFVEDATTTVATAAKNSTTIAMNAIPPIGDYIWSNGYYATAPVVLPVSTGIPNGTKVTAVNGLDAAHFAYVGNVVNAFNAAALTPLTLRGTFTSASSLTSIPMDTAGYYVVRARAAAVPFVYTWNTTTSAWASLGSFLPIPWAVANAIVVTRGNNHVNHWNGTSWDDLGTPIATIAPCDPVADHATGCPSTPYPGLMVGTIPGCDPKVTYKTNGINVLNTAGGCSAGTPPAWNGTTRALSGEKVLYTQAMTILPAGYWTHNDFEGAGSSGFMISGGVDNADSVDPTHPNLIVNASCMSMKDNIVRDGYNGFLMAKVKNTILYNNKVKWMSADGFDGYTVNRVWWIHNFYSDPTVIWAHQDELQLGTSNGRGENAATTDAFYGNAAIENEFYVQTDPTNYFPRPVQGINNTEHSLYDTYVCCNVITVSSSGGGIQIAGHYNAVVHNDVFGLNTLVGHHRKGRDLTPIYSMLANNIGNGVSRDNGIPNYCDPTVGDMDIVEGNVSLPFLPPAGLQAFSVLWLMRPVRGPCPEHIKV